MPQTLLERAQAAEARALRANARAQAVALAAAGSQEQSDDAQADALRLEQRGWAWHAGCARQYAVLTKRAASLAALWLAHQCQDYAEEAVREAEEHAKQADFSASAIAGF